MTAKSSQREGAESERGLIAHSTQRMSLLPGTWKHHAIAPAQCYSWHKAQGCVPEHMASSSCQKLYD